MAILHIDGKSYEVEAGQNLLHVALSLGIDLPYFCWHPALGSVGACRQCACKQYRDENDQQGRLVMACMTPVTDGLRITVDDPDSKTFRAAVIESLMTNHPHDCPICDEGGECHLQDMTVMSGHNYRDYRFKKRTFNNQYLGPFINHEMNRCITCYRCVRFYRDYAGGRDLDAFASKNHVYFGRFEDGKLENEFSGNLAEVCPTGVFTDKTLKEHYTRKWDLQTAPSICVGCAVGCNTIPGERYGEIRRILNRYNGDVNGYFICDRGRFGYSFVNSPRRIRQARIGSEETSKESAIAHIAELLKNARGVIGIGSPRASLESNFALRSLVGADRFYNGLSTSEARLTSTALKILKSAPARSASLRDAENADAVLILGEDVINTAPMLALKLRQSVRRVPMAATAQVNIPEWHDLAVRERVQDEKGPFFIASVRSTLLDDVGTETFRLAPEEIARFGFAVANAIDSSAPGPESPQDWVLSAAGRVASALKNASHPLVVAGTSLGSESVLNAAANVAASLASQGLPAGISLNFPECNTLGVALIESRGIQEAAEAVVTGQADTVIILENDLYRRGTSKEVDGLLSAAKHVIVIDHLENSTTAKAEAVLPGGTFAESDGTLVNSEGRVQGFFQVFPAAEPIQESWRWLRDLLEAAGDSRAKDWKNLDDVLDHLAQEIPYLAPAREAVVSADFRIQGLKIPRQAHRYSGRTAMRAHVNIHEPKPPEDPDSPLTFSMEGYLGRPPSALAPRFWAPGWNSVQSLNKFQEEVGGPMRGGDSGRRLIEPGAGPSWKYYSEIPHAVAGAEGELQVAPLYHIFGSEELSVHTPGIADLVPSPYVLLHPEDAAALKVEEGSDLEVSFGAGAVTLKATFDPSIARGVAGIPIGLPNFPEAVSSPLSIQVAQGAGR